MKGVLKTHCFCAAAAQVMDIQTLHQCSSKKCGVRTPLPPLRALEGRPKLAQGKRGQELGTAVPHRGTLGQESRPTIASPPESPAFRQFGGEAGSGGRSFQTGKSHVSLPCECWFGRSVIYGNGDDFPPSPLPSPPTQKTCWGRGSKPWECWATV